MSAHFRWYPSSEEVVVPWNAKYSFPSQANKAVKMTPRIPPKNGASFVPGSVIRLEFPAQGFVNTINTMLEFDVTLFGWNNTSTTEYTQFQNNIQSVFSRVRLLYGSTPLEDLINYNQIVRNLTEHTATNQNGSYDQLTIMDGIGGYVGNNHVRRSYIQGISGSINVPNTQNPSNVTGNGSSRYSTRRYQVNLALGLLMQDKLLPVKFMASQLAIEITLEQPAACIITQNTVTTGASPTYALSNVNLIPEVLEFDASYDSAFLTGLQGGGVPLKFSSWHTFSFATGGSSAANLQVQERSRSVKALFACQRRQPYSIYTDSGATFLTSGTGVMTEYQWRIGARYFPSQPVQNSFGDNITNGACESYAELQKALNVVGDYRLSTSNNVLRWATTNSTAGITTNITTSLNELDYACSTTANNANGDPTYTEATVPACGNLGSSCYISAIDLETSSGVEVSGLNAEEQSDIAFIAKWSANQDTSFAIEVYTYYDAMIILKENNQLELIQ